MKPNTNHQTLKNTKQRNMRRTIAGRGRSRCRRLGLSRGRKSCEFESHKQHYCNNIPRNRHFLLSYRTETSQSRKPKIPRKCPDLADRGAKGKTERGGEEEEEFNYGRRMTQNYAIYSPLFESRTRENIENATKDHMVDNDMWSGGAQSITLTLLKVGVHPVWIGMF